MLKLRSMMENVAEKTFGRLLPQVRAQAGGCVWIFAGCCGPGNSQTLMVEECDHAMTGNWSCAGNCPQ